MPLTRHRVHGPTCWKDLEPALSWERMVGQTMGICLSRQPWKRQLEVGLGEGAGRRVRNCIFGVVGGEDDAYRGQRGRLESARRIV